MVIFFTLLQQGRTEKNHMEGRERSGSGGVGYFTQTCTAPALGFQSGGVGTGVRSGRCWKCRCFHALGLPPREDLHPTWNHNQRGVGNFSTQDWGATTHHKRDHSPSTTHDNAVICPHHKVVVDFRQHRRVLFMLK